MRGSGGNSSVTMGVPNNGRGEGHHRPSRLELMREDYHRKILREKEQKMVELCEQAQLSKNRTVMRMMGSGDEGARGGSSSMSGTPNSGGPSVRDFFNERRRMEASGVPVPPIDDHFRKTKGYSSPGGWSSRTGSGNSSKKCSAGRDRSQPLAPIRRGSDSREPTRIGSNASRRDRIGSGGRTGHDENNPFNAKPRMVRHKPLPPTNSRSNAKPHEEYAVDGNNNDTLGQTHGRHDGYQGIHQHKYQRVKLQQQQQQQQPQRQEQELPPEVPTTKPQKGGNINKHVAVRQARASGSNNSSQAPKLTDFQKWQMEQNKAREERLKKLNSQKNDENRHRGYMDNDDDGYGDDDEDYDDGDGDDGSNERQDDNKSGEENDGEARRLERELLQKIERETAELERLRLERVAAEEEEKREFEDRKKREQVERAKQKKMEELRRKEEEQRRKEEEEEERRERLRDEKERKEEEKRQREAEKQRKEEEKKAEKREKEEQKRQAKLQKQQAKDSARSNTTDTDYDSRDETPGSSSLHHPLAPAPAVHTLEEVDERPVANADASFYAQVAKSNDAKGSVGSLATCRVCGRSFAMDRLKRHQEVCKKANKPRKEFDSSKKRVEGTEAAKYIDKRTKEPPKKNNNWRANHEEFINSLRYAKKVAQYEKEGKDVRHLTPPPTTEDPNLVACPYCNRTFNSTAAERHIPRCKDLKTKPPPVKARRR